MKLAETYRGARRNQQFREDFSNEFLGKAWQGAKKKYKDTHPPLVQVTSKRGEKHYAELWN